ncbi:unnamed protein product [Cylicocyclus nassatus]|uniref:G-protein coupled receptors family 1 profile domain-containing protein n=1 Tax=Cylicocyclus nassatus TaxID=53992 RepID=A0AA36HD63_CYLNA|nr:unnamed protein product [Cylicocyclus nassatus]
MALIFINSTILIIWGAYIYIGLWPNEQLLKQMQTPLLLIIGIDLRTNGAVGICLRPQLAWPNLIVMIISVIIILALTLAGIVCAVQIRRKLRRASLSAQTKKMQHRMNNLLMIQTCCPVVFLQLPAVAQYVMMYSGATTDSTFSNSSTILWMFYPISGPLVTLIFMKEYRDYYLSKLGSFKSQHRSHQTSGPGYGKNVISTTDSNRQFVRTAYA